MVSGCNVTTNQVGAEVYSTGTGNYTEAAKAADEAIAAITPSPDITVPATMEAGKLTIAADEAYPPLEYLAKVFTNVGGEESDSVELVGFEVDLYTAVAKKLGLEPVYVKVGFSSLTEVLTEGEKVDMAASGIITTPEMLNQFAASETYLPADLAICSRSGVELSDETSLQGKIVGVQTGSTAETYVDGMQGIAEKRLYPHVVGAFADLRDGEIDALVLVRPVAEWILSTDAEYATAITMSDEGIETGQGYAFWCNKTDQALMDAINAALEELRQAPESATATDQSGAAASMSVYSLLLQKWGLTSD